MKHIFHTILIISLCLLYFSCNKEKKKSISIENIQIDDNYDVNPDTNIVNLIAHYKTPLDEEINEVIAVSVMEMETEKPEGLLNNYITDLYYEFAKNYCHTHKLDINLDAAITNIHGLRTSLPKGNITIGKVFEIMPFDNKLMIVKMQGSVLKRLLNHIARVGGEGVSHIQMEIKKDNKAGKILINGQSLQKDKIYHILSLDYLINGGSGMTAFSNNIGIIDLNMPCRDAIISYLKEETKKGCKISSKLDGRIYYETR